MSGRYAHQPVSGLKTRLAAAMLALVIVAAPVVMVAGDGSGLRAKASRILGDVSAVIGSLPYRLGLGGSDLRTDDRSAGGDRKKSESYPSRFDFLADRMSDPALISGDVDYGAGAHRVEVEKALAEGDREGGDADGRPQDDARSFSEIFSAFAMPGTKPSGSLDAPMDPSADPSTRRTPDGMLAVDYNLGQPGLPAGVIEIMKLLHVDGVDKGKVTLRIVNDTTILVNSRQLAEAMNNQRIRKSLSAIASPYGDNSYLDFDALRAAGFDVRYDPIRDAVILASSKP
ncbi:MAG: hypothetical protein KUG65_07370 [Sphingomonadaceae bacterium]|nr:hypothetical protein [Sphingomonadaceae bacterium]